MKIIGVVLALLLVLSGCEGGAKEMDRALGLRSKLLAGEGCTFQADITADYGDKVHSFSVSCEGDAQGNLEFEVTKPETIAGITGQISESGGKLTFDDTTLQFDLLTDDQLSPVSAPWVFLRTLRGGYLLGAAQEGEQLYIQAKDSYADNALLVDLWLGAEDLPVRGEILWKNRRILTLEIQDFQIQGS